MKNLDDINFINLIKEIQKSSLEVFPDDNFSLEQSARGYFFLKFINEKNKNNIPKYISVCSNCGGENKFYGPHLN